MARMRTTKPEFWTDEDLADLPRDARLLYMGLWNLADEHSRLRGRPDYIKGQLFPYDDDLTPAVVGGLLDALAGAGKVVRYTVEGRSYVFLPNLCRHQRLEPEKVPSRLPPPPGPDSSGLGADESAPHAKDHALSREHVAGSRQQQHARDRAPAAAERIVLEAVDGCSADEARAMLDRLKREKKPRNLTGLLVKIREAGELPALLGAVRAERAKADAASALATIRAGPPCEHGEPGGDQPHPSTRLPVCPLCRKSA